jgi:hypothetical protein
VSTLARLLIPLALLAAVFVSAATTHRSQPVRPPQPERSLLSHR